MRVWVGVGGEEWEEGFYEKKFQDPVLSEKNMHSFYRNPFQKRLGVPESKLVFTRPPFFYKWRKMYQIYQIPLTYSDWLYEKIALGPVVQS